jgi:hypothetical protein
MTDEVKAAHERLAAALREAAEVIGDGFTRSSESDTTSWDECVMCGRADWRGHTDGCQMGRLVKDIKAALASHESRES